MNMLINYILNKHVILKLSRLLKTRSPVQQPHFATPWIRPGLSDYHRSVATPVCRQAHVFHHRYPGLLFSYTDDRVRHSSTGYTAGIRNTPKTFRGENCRSVARTWIIYSAITRGLGGRVKTFLISRVRMTEYYRYIVVERKQYDLPACRRCGGIFNFFTFPRKRVTLLYANIIKMVNDFQKQF